MVTIYLVVPVLVVIALVQATVMPHVAVWGIFPDLPVLLVSSWGLLRGQGEGAVWGFIAGAALDLLSGAPFGAATLALIAVGATAGLAKGSALQAHVALPLLTVFLASILYDLVFLFVLRVAGDTVVWVDSFVRIILPSAVLNAVLIPPVLGLMRWLDNRYLREEMEW